jgi:hypothetical protein
VLCPWCLWLGSEGLTRICTDEADLRTGNGNSRSLRDDNKKKELVLHNDAKSEYAYGPATGLPDAHVVTFSESLLTEAKKNAWVVISMKNDWKRIFPLSSKAAPDGARDDQIFVKQASSTVLSIPSWVLRV